MPIRQAAVWLDHEQARIFHVDPDSVERFDLRIAHHIQRADAEIADDRSFFDAIADCLADAAEVLVVGPGVMKLDLVKCFKAHHKLLAKRVVGVESSDQPTDGRLVAHIRKHFPAADWTHAKARGNARVVAQSTRAAPSGPPSTFSALELRVR